MVGRTLLRAWRSPLVLVALVLSLFSHSAFSGERLRLRTGETDIDVANGRLPLSPLKVRPFAAVDGDPEEDLSWVGTKEKKPKVRLISRSNLRGARHFVVQMRDRVTQKDIVNFRSLRVRVLRYLPDDAFVVEASPNQIQVLARSSPTIRAIAAYRPEWKLSPELGVSSVFSGDPKVAALLRLFPGESAGRVAPRFSKSQCRVETPTSPVEGSLVVTCPRSLLQSVASQIDEIEWIEPLAEFSTAWFQDPALRSYLVSQVGDYRDLTGFESGTKLLGFGVARERGFSGGSETIGFADSGLDRGSQQDLHEDFKGRVDGYSYGLFSKSWADPDGHGTHVAGSVAGSGALSKGRIQGGAPEAKLIAQSLWSPRLKNLSIPRRVESLFESAYSSGARIHTNSWGSAGVGIYDSMAQQVDSYVREHPEFLVLFAAGNGGEDVDRDGRVDSGSINAPGTAKNVLTVGASKNLVLSGGIQMSMRELGSSDRWPAEPLASSQFSETDRGLAAFSSRGPTADGRLKPEVVAPGTNILSARSQHASADVLWGSYNDSYVWSGGTSMATPLVAAAASVVREYLIQDRRIPNPSAAIVKGVLMHSATDLFPGQFGTSKTYQELTQARPNFDEGFGRVDLVRATDLSQSLIVDERNGLGPAEQHLYPVTLSRYARVELTLVYTDAPAAAAAAQALVNDLDVAIIDRSGRRIELLDRTNNFEHLDVELPAGAYQIEVRGYNVPIGSQSYALIVSVR